MRTPRSDQAIDNFNQIIANLSPRIDKDLTLENLKEFNGKDLVPISQRTLQLLYTPLNPPLNELTIYYPVSRYDEFPNSPITYVTNIPIRPIDILQTIVDTYKTPLQKANIDAYIMEDDEQYSDLLEIPNPQLSDAMSDNVFLQSLQPFQKGYVLNLGS